MTLLQGDHGAMCGNRPTVMTLTEKPFEAASPDASHLTLSELPEIFQGLMGVSLMSGPCCVRSVKSFGGS